MGNNKKWNEESRKPLIIKEGFEESLKKSLNIYHLHLITKIYVQISIKLIKHDIWRWHLRDLSKGNMAHKAPGCKSGFNYQDLIGIQSTSGLWRKENSQKSFNVLTTLKFSKNFGNIPNILEIFQNVPIISKLFHNISTFTFT